MENNVENVNNNNDNMNPNNLISYIDFDYSLLLNDASIFNLNNSRNIEREINEMNQNLENSIEIRNKKTNSTIKCKAIFSIIRLTVLYIIVLFDHKPMNNHLKIIIFFLVIHDLLLIINFIFVGIFRLIKYLSNNNNFYSSFPSLFRINDKIITIIFFIWFIYSNIIIIKKKTIFNDDKSNKFIKYYLFFVLIYGYYAFSIILFYVLFIILFSPCLIYMAFNSFRQHNQQQRRVEEILKNLKVKSFKDYQLQYGNEVDGCIICGENFETADKIIELPCNNKHIFHEKCIKSWIAIKATCPICRADLNPVSHSESDSYEAIPGNI